MYEAFYGLREKPFNLTPDPKFLYLSEKHKEAFAHLLYGIKNRSGFVMLTGEIGTGKTTICRNLLNQLDSDTEVAFIFNPFLGPVELLRKINTEFGIATKADNLLGLTEELNIHLLNAAARGKNCVLVIDEAQNLDPKVLEQIRLLSNLETESNKLIQIILIGQPELGEKLDLHELRQLNQRITARYHLKPLNAAETLQYIAYRIHVAGGRKSVSFTKSAVKQVFKVSGGTPRMINAICDRCLLIGYTREEHEINPVIVRRAAKEIKGDKVRVKRPKEGHFLARLLPSPSLIIAALLVVIVALLFSGSLDRLSGELGKFNRGMFGNDSAASVSTPLTGVTEAAAPDKPESTLSGMSDHASEASAVAPISKESAPTAESIIAKRVLDRLNAVPKKPAVLETPSKSPLELLSVSAESTRDAGVVELLKVWGADASSGFSGEDKPETWLKFFQDKSLACEILRPGTEQLIAMNLPALVRVKVEDQLRWVTLVKASDDIMTVTLGPDKTLPLRRTSFRDIYQNEAIIPWRDATPTAQLLLPGQKGGLVVALKQHLRSLNLINAKNTHDIYDSETASAIAAIQAETGLKIDGKAGRQVRMVVASWTGANGPPALRQRKPLDMVTVENTVSASAEGSVKQIEKQPEPEQSPSETPPALPVAAEKTDTGQESSQPAPPPVVAPESPATQPVPEGTAPEVSGNPEKPAELPAAAAVAPSTATEASEGEYRADAGTPLQVRELPDPTGVIPLAPPESTASGERTEPVSGSSPLVPHVDSAV